MYPEHDEQTLVLIIQSASIDEKMFVFPFSLQAYLGRSEYLSLFYISFISLAPTKYEHVRSHCTIYVGASVVQW